MGVVVAVAVEVVVGQEAVAGIAAAVAVAGIVAQAEAEVAAVFEKEVRRYVDDWSAC
jgi:hypothetical protein